jgi:protein RecA
MIRKKIKIKDLQDLLKENKNILIKSKGGKFVPIKSFIEKGYIETYEIILEDNYSIKVSPEHLFYSNNGWIETTKIINSQNENILLLCSDNKFRKVLLVNKCDKSRIIDLEVNDVEHCFFSNGILGHNSGKSLIIAHMIADVQRRNGIAVLISSEIAESPEYMEAVGVNLNDLIYMNLHTVEDAFEAVETIIKQIRVNEPDKLLLIALDSLTALSTKNEQDENYDAQGYGMEKAKLCSKAFRKITESIGKMRVAFVFTNQLRMKLNVPAFADPFVMPGGQAILFYSSIIVRLKKIGQIKGKIGKIEKILGINVKAKTEKNRLGPPLRTCTFPIYFDRGINNAESIYNELIALEYIDKPKGATTCGLNLYDLIQKCPEDLRNQYSNDDISEIYESLKARDVQIKDKSIKFKLSTWSSIFEDELFKTFIIDILSEHMRLKYFRHGISEETIDIEESNEE